MKTRLLFILFPLLLLATLFAVLGFLWTRGYSYELTNVTYAEAGKTTVVKTFIPPQAREITAWIMPFRMNVVASFRISEEDFRAWARTKRWKLDEAENAMLANISRVGDPNDQVSIQKGLVYRWVYDDQDPGSTFRIYAYDRITGTGYFTQLGD